uniref:hypothetical protein n=1 Tax=Streptomyces noursei TaxID=1971 RepID=UPI0003A25E56|nr:hypothetical protein [Streptomyces noursei]
MEPQAGGCRKQGGVWLVYCDEHTAAGSAPAATLMVAGAVEDSPPAEVRITGSPAQCEAIREALVVGLGLRIGACSEPQPRRDPHDNRVAVYAKVTVDAPTLALIERDMKP